jgi:hypothetical protein
VVGFVATLITMSGFGDHLAGLSDHVDRNAHLIKRGSAIEPPTISVNELEERS